MESLGSVTRFDFFFSSRRRHTRYWRDWSSDVCSSDLGHFNRPVRQRLQEHVQRQLLGAERLALELQVLLGVVAAVARSEERRVGKEGRCRGGAYDGEKKERRVARRVAEGETRLLRSRA